VRQPGLRVVPPLEDDVLGALSDRRREQLFKLLEQAAAGLAPRLRSHGSRA
jgi:hypothetical protein